MGGDLSAARLLSELSELGVQLEARGDRLAFRPRSVITPELHERLTTHKEELLRILQVLQDEVELFDIDPKDLKASDELLAAEVVSVKENSPASWSATDAALIERFQECRELPQGPFLLRPGCRVENAAEFYRSLKSDIEAGPNGPRGGGALQADLRALCELLEDG